MQPFGCVLIIPMDIFSAISDPTRRLILEKLRSGQALSIKELTASTSVSRQAVTKHLEVLKKAGLIEFEMVGKQRLNKIRYQKFAELTDWLAPYAKEWELRLSNLQNFLENNDE